MKITKILPENSNQLQKKKQIFFEQQGKLIIYFFL